MTYRDRRPQPGTLLATALVFFAAGSTVRAQVATVTDWNGAAGDHL